MHWQYSNSARFRCIFAAAASFLLLAAGGQARAQPPYKQNVYFDFRRSQAPIEPLKLFGPEVNKSARLEEKGLRFIIPANRPKLDPIGVSVWGTVRGDFEITTGYELLQTPKSTAGQGIGFELYVGAFNPTDDALAYTRVIRPKGDAYFCTRMTTPNGKRQYSFQELPTKVNPGWLRLTRHGATVEFQASDKPNGPFQEVWSIPFIADDLQMVRLAAYSGGDPAAFDIRLTDLRIRSTDVKSTVAPPPPPSEVVQLPIAESAASPWWVAGAIALGFLVGTLAGAMVIWWILRARGRASINQRVSQLRSKPTESGKEDSRRAVRFTVYSMVGVALLTAACATYANLAFLVSDGAIYVYFPPFKPHANANVNRHLGAEYLNIARSLAAGDGFANPFRERTGPTAWMPPILPFLLAGLLWLCNGNLDAITAIVVFVQSLVLAGTGVMVLAIVHQTCGRWASATAGVIFAGALLFDFHLHFQMTHDSWLVLLAMDLLIAGLCWGKPLTGSGRALLWGVAGGTAVLINPVVGLVWSGLTALVAVRQRAWRALACTGLVAAILVLPWSVRNFTVFGRLVPVKSNAAYELYQSQCLQDDGLLQLHTFATHPYGRPGEERKEYKEMGEMAFLDHKHDQFWKSVSADPLDFANRIACRFLGVTVWYVPLERETERIERPWTFWLSRLIYPLPFIGFLVVLVAGIAGRLHPVQWTVLGIYLIYLLPYIAISYYERYGVPLLAVKSLLVIWAIDILSYLWRPRCAPAI